MSVDRNWYLRFFVVVGLTALAWLSLWPSLDAWVPAPPWVKTTFENRISPGLDIRGGLRLVYEVEVDEAIRDRRDRQADQVLPSAAAKLGILEKDDVATPSREQLEKARASIKIKPLTNRRFSITLARASQARRLDRAWFRETFPDLRRLSEEGNTITLELREDRLEELRNTAVQQAVKTIKNRVDELAIREMTVIGRDSDIIIEIPGGDDLSTVINTLVKNLTLNDSNGTRSGTAQMNVDNLAKASGLKRSVVRNALDKLEAQGVIRRAGDLIEVPDLRALRSQETFDRVRSIVARTAQLEFKILDDESEFVANLGDLPEGIRRSVESSTAGANRPVTPAYLLAEGSGARERLSNYIASLTMPEGRELLVGRGDPPPDADGGGQGAPVQRWRTYFLFSNTELTGEDVDDAYVGNDEKGRTVVQIEFGSRGAETFGRITGANVKRRMAIVLDDVVESAPMINERIAGGRCQISLGFGSPQQVQQEAAALVVVLKAGALPAPIRPSNEQLLEATLGADAIEQGAKGAAIGVGLVLIFMLVYYSVGGMVADLMVVLNVMFLLAILAFFEATLTLPGVAGIALTVGMAVDANVLITERIREELRLGKSPRAAVDQGFSRAFGSIFDSQLTTLVAGVVLFQFGTGPIKGFAVTLMIGIVSSLFTGVFCSRVLFDWIVQGLRVRTLRVG